MKEKATAYHLNRELHKVRHTTEKRQRNGCASKKKQKVTTHLCFCHISSMTAQDNYSLRKNSYEALISPKIPTYNEPVRDPSYSKKHATQLEHIASLRIDHTLKSRLTHVICTIGPKTNSPQGIADLRKAGMNIVRMNFSHGTHESHATVIENVKKSYELYPGSDVAIALDTKGPEIRTGFCRDGKDVEISKDQIVVLETDEAFKNLCDGNAIYCDYKALATTVRLGQLIFVADGMLTLEVTEVNVEKNNVTTRAHNAAKFGSRKNMALPMCKVDLPALSEQDIKDMGFAIKYGVDIIFASFVRRASDVLEMRKVLGPSGKNIKIVSKIENFEGVHNFDQILEVSDGIMVARGDLGMDLNITKVFLAQKSIITLCNMVGKPVIVATQMLESMIKNPRPTRAEVTDVANAVLDGADCVMLSGETANGDYPIDCVNVMNEICLEAECAYWNASFFAEMMQVITLPTSTTETIASSTVNASFQQGAAAIIVLSTSGQSARAISKYRARCPIICVTRFAETSRQLQLCRGCVPALYPEYKEFKDIHEWQLDVDARIRYGVKIGIESGLLDASLNQVILCLQGNAPKSGHTNTLRILHTADWK